MVIFQIDKLNNILAFMVMRENIVPEYHDPNDGPFQVSAVSGWMDSQHLRDPSMYAIERRKNSS